MREIGDDDPVELPTSWRACLHSGGGVGTDQVAAPG